jgi:uncharacterized protein YceH (UPF0502 family)
MSPETESAAAPAPVAWPFLSVNERRVLGVLVEKAKTTPDAYPLSVNALVTGSNQKSNRDPLLDLSELDVDEALVAAQQKGLAMKLTGGRVIRWRHYLYEAWNVNKVELAVLGELLLRGPQTEGELRSRASRMEPIDDLDALRAVLKLLVERRLVVYLTPEGRRGTVVTHGFHDPRELERLRTRHHAAEEAAAAPASRATPATAYTAPPAPADDRVPALEARLAEATAEVAALRSIVGDLQTAVGNLAEQVRHLKEALGV